MKRTTEEIYAAISHGILKGIEGSFSDAVLEVELHSLALKLSGGYLRGDGTAPVSFRFNKDDKKTLMNDLIELHITTHIGDKKRWNTMNFSFHPTGEYKVEFEWDEELAESVERVYAEA